MSAKNLIASFVKGEIMKNDLEPRSSTERVGSRPGVTRKLVSDYETKGEEVRLEGVARLNILIVFCHIKRKSFNGTLLDAAVEQLTVQGHKVTVSDLYDMNFNPVASRNNVKDHPPVASFNHTDDAAEAFLAGKLAEQRKVKDADLIIFQFPIFWGGFPAMLKGWLDRILIGNFAYSHAEGDTYDKGYMKGKKVMFSMTLGAIESSFQVDGLQGDINAILWPMHYLGFRFGGFEILAPFLVYGVTQYTMTSDLVQQKVAEYKKRLKTIHCDQPLHFISKDHFNQHKQLTDKAKREFEMAEFGPSIGCHLGKPLPPDSMTKAH